MAKALVVDDSRAVRMILSRTLKDLGFEVCEAANGREALAELLKQLRQKPELASLVVVMVTTETELDQMAAALEAGANEYVMKPFTKDILVEKLQLVGIHP